MRVLDGLSRVFKRRGSAPGGVAATADHEHDAEPGTGLPVAIELDSSSPGESTPLSRRELAAELQKNYNEVLALVRKVDEHLDVQERRSAELMALAERATQAAEALPHIRTQQAELNEAVSGFTESAREHQHAMLVAVRDQASTIDAHTETLRDFGSSVTTSVGGMTDATDRLGQAIASMRETDLARERELNTLVERSHKTMLTVLIACGVLAIGGIATALVVGLS